MNRRRAHLSTARAGILDALIDQPEACTVAALAALIGQHPNTIREHLDALVTARLVIRTRAAAHGRGRPAWLYSASPEVGTDQVAREYADLAAALAAQIVRNSPDPGADAIDAGRMWGQGRAREYQANEGQDSGATRSASAVGIRRKVVTLIENLGFAPTTDARVGVVKLNRCPLLEEAHRNPDVVCAVHLGFVRGALEELGADRAGTEGTALKPFAESGACRLDLLPRAKA